MYNDCQGLFNDVKDIHDSPLKSLCPRRVEVCRDITILPIYYRLVKTHYKYIYTLYTYYHVHTN